MIKIIKNYDYQTPEVMVVKIESVNVICASPLTVSDPWTGNVEETW